MDNKFWREFYKEFRISSLTTTNNHDDYLEVTTYGGTHRIVINEPDVNFSMPSSEFKRLADFWGEHANEETLRGKNPGLNDIYNKYRTMLALLASENQ